MNLLLDIGNTNLRWALQDDDGIAPAEVVRHGAGVPLDLLAAWERLAPPQQVLASNVSGALVAEAITRVTRSYWGLEPEFVQVAGHWGDLRVCYAEPARFGVDRWLALIAAHAHSHDATLILDAGTAVTFDVVLADGQHLGGLILPGIEMMRSSLLVGTQFPMGELRAVPECWACDTGAAVGTGAVQAIVALASRLHDQLAERVCTAPRLLLTGGDAAQLEPFLERPFEHLPDLVLRGLDLFARTSGRE